MLNVCGSVTTFDSCTASIVLLYTKETSCPVVYFWVHFQVLLPKVGSLFILGVCGNSPVKKKQVYYISKQDDRKPESDRLQWAQFHLDAGKHRHDQLWLMSQQGSD